MHIKTIIEHHYKPQRVTKGKSIDNPRGGQKTDIQKVPTLLMEVYTGKNHSGKLF